MMMINNRFFSTSVKMVKNNSFISRITRREVSSITLHANNASSSSNNDNNNCNNYNIDNKIKEISQQMPPKPTSKRKPTNILRPAIFVRTILKNNMKITTTTTTTATTTGNGKLNIKDLDRNNLGKYLNGKKLMGLDIGESKIGLSISDGKNNIFATPLPETIYRSHPYTSNESITETTKQLNALIIKHGCCGIIAGWPKDLSGHAGPQCMKVQRFLDSFTSKQEDLAGMLLINNNNNNNNNDTKIPITVWDETFTTQESRQLLSQIHTSMTHQRKTMKEDSVAAALILQDFLDTVLNKREDLIGFNFMNELRKKK